MNKIVLITGATSGYGLAAAKKFKDSGDTVIIASRNAEKVAMTVKENGFDCGFRVDVKNYDEWENLCKKVVEKYGRIDVLVNNAGGGVRIAHTTEQTAEDIDNRKTYKHKPCGIFRCPCNANPRDAGRGNETCRINMQKKKLHTKTDI